MFYLNLIEEGVQMRWEWSQGVKNPRMDLNTWLDWVSVQDTPFSPRAALVSHDKGLLEAQSLLEMTRISLAKLKKVTPTLREREPSGVWAHSWETITVIVNPRSDVRFDFAVKGFINLWWNVSQNLNYSFAIVLPEVWSFVIIFHDTGYSHTPPPVTPVKDDWLGLYWHQGNLWLSLGVHLSPMRFGFRSRMRKGRQ